MLGFALQTLRGGANSLTFFFVCLSVTLLIGQVYENGITTKPFELKTVLMALDREKFVVMRAHSTFFLHRQMVPIEMLNLKMWSNLGFLAP